ncbi:hypothetical protein ACUN0C_12255 [Faunimonas sp. B44]|uniref:hypothetical protein n=1 Tax=Faunimonas sp. B44 TaxID=3461493 RepID=UPI004044285E
MPSASGRIALAQEGRFRLEMEDGRSALFLLHRLARVQPQDLPALVASGRRVTVRYDAAPGRIANLAREISLSSPRVSPA